MTDKMTKYVLAEADYQRSLRFGTYFAKMRLLRKYGLTPSDLKHWRTYLETNDVKMRYHRYNLLQ